MVTLQANGHVNGVGDYDKGSKSDYVKIGEPLYYCFRWIIRPLIACEGLILINNNQKYKLEVNYVYKTP